MSSSMKRLALTLPTLSPLGGGVAEAARLHVAALADAGFEEISIHTLDISMEKVDRAQWGKARLWLNGFIGPKSYSFAPKMLWTLLRSKPDIVHVHGVWQFHCLAVWLWSKLTGKPYVVTPHGMLEPWIRARSPGLKKAVSTLYQDRFLRGAAGFHLLTDKEVSDVAEYRTGQPADIIRNYVEPFMSDGARPGWWKAGHEGRRVYLFLGRIHEKKGCMELCDAWERLSDEDPAFRHGSLLVFCGWNDGLEGFEARVESLGRKHGNALFAGPQYGMDKNRSLDAATFFMLPSKSEGLPMAVLEAWAAGKPAILSPECNLPIGYQEGAAFETGFTVETIHASLVRTAGMSDEAIAVAGRKAAALAAREFSADRVRSALVDLYRAAILWKAKRP